MMINVFAMAKTTFSSRTLKTLARLSRLFEIKKFPTVICFNFTWIMWMYDDVCIFFDEVSSPNDPLIFYLLI